MGFREEMEHVLLLDMSIHHFDFLRHALGSDPVVEVYCDEFNPAWSWYRHGAATTLVLRFASGARATYTASWCSPGAETSWNAHWRFSGPAGTVVWDGDNAPEVDVPNDASVVAPVLDGPTGLAASLTLMVDYLRGGPEPDDGPRQRVQPGARVRSDRIRTPASAGAGGRRHRTRTGRCRRVGGLAGTRRGCQGTDTLTHKAIPSYQATAPNRSKKPPRPVHRRRGRRDDGQRTLGDRLDSVVPVEIRGGVAGVDRVEPDLGNCTCVQG